MTTDWDTKVAEALNDEEPEPAPHSNAVGTPAVPIQPLHVVVVGSAAWDEPLLVQAALIGWSQRHADHPVILWTAGAPTGAEYEAREFAYRNGWRTSESNPELLVEMESTVVFGFVSGEGLARDLLETIATRRPVRVMTLETLRPKTRWNEW